MASEKQHRRRVDQPRGKDGRFRKTRAAPTMDDFAILIIEMDRKTGVLKPPDLEFATPAEAWSMCARMADMLLEQLEDAQWDADSRRYLED